MASSGSSSDNRFESHRRTEVEITTELLRGVTPQMKQRFNETTIESPCLALRASIDIEVCEVLEETPIEDVFAYCKAQGGIFLGGEGLMFAWAICSLVDEKSLDFPLASQTFSFTDDLNGDVHVLRRGTGNIWGYNQVRRPKTLKVSNCFLVFRPTLSAPLVVPT